MTETDGSASVKQPTHSFRINSCAQCVYNVDFVYAPTLKMTTASWRSLLTGQSSTSPKPSQFPWFHWAAAAC